MPKRQIYKKLDTTGNIEDLGFTVTQEEINNWNEINNISTKYAEKTHTHTEYLGKNGNAASATKATKDGNGNVIASTYLPVTGGSINGNLTITGNITQNGSTYITHAEEVRTTKDYIYLRDGATGSLANNSYSGFEFVKYDGTNNGRLVVDNKGIARVGDVGDEQPLATREETPTNGGFAKWDSNSSKFITDTNVATADHTHTKSEITDFTHTHNYLPLSGGNVTGNIYLTGAQSNSSTGNTTQLIFGTASDNHVAITSNKNALVINPTSVSSANQVVLYTSTTLESKLPGPINIGGKIKTPNIDLSASGTINLLGNTNATGAKLQWGTVSNNAPYTGFATDQSDGTFILSSLKGTTYASGLAIGGGSGNLLWKGVKVATVNDISSASSIKFIDISSDSYT